MRFLNWKEASKTQTHWINLAAPQDLTCDEYRGMCTCMTGVEDDEPLIDWEARTRQIRREHFELFDFVYRGEKSGEITEEAAEAYYRKSFEVRHRAGTLSSSLDNENDRALLYSILRQENHEACMAMLAIQPELREPLEQAVPSMRGRTR